MEEIKKIFENTESLIIFLTIIGLTILFAKLLGKYLQRLITEKTKDHQGTLPVLFF